MNHACVLVSLLILAQPTAAYAEQRWEQVATSSDGLTWAIDRATVVVKENVVTAWFQVDHSGKRISPTETERLELEKKLADRGILVNDGRNSVLNRAGEDRISYERDKWTIECSTRRLAILSNTSYRSDGSVISTKSWPKANFEEAVPDSVGEQLLENVCKRFVS